MAIWSVLASIIFIIFITSIGSGIYLLNHAETRKRFSFEMDVTMLAMVLSFILLGLLLLIAGYLGYL